MERVQFEKNADEYAPGVVRHSVITRLVVKLHLAKDNKSADRVMIIIAVIASLAAIFIYTHYVFGYNPFAKKVTPDYSNLPPDVQKILQPSSK